MKFRQQVKWSRISDNNITNETQKVLSQLLGSRKNCAGIMMESKL